MTTTNTCKNLYELQLTIDQLPSDHIFDKSVPIAELVASSGMEEYVGLIDHEFNETHIYRRTNFSSLTDLSILKWDGSTIDTTWYNKKDQTYVIQNAEQLAGFAALVDSGVTFRGKTVKLGANINLNYKEWTPIGKLDTVEKVGSHTDYFFDPHIPENGCFEGTFDGCGFVIYGLKMCNVDPDGYFVGFFKSLKNATVKQLCFSNVFIGCSDRYSYFAGLFGYAEGCRFENICITGSITGQHCAGIGCVSSDSSFYHCMNYAGLNGDGSHDGCSIVIGGMVIQVGLTRDIIKKIDGQTPTIFSKCYQNGEIIIDGSDIGSVYVGQMYGNVAYSRGKMDPYGFAIDRCHFDTLNIPIINNLQEGTIRGTYYGLKNVAEEPINFVSGIQDKSDLLCGLIGKTPTDLAITIQKITSSTKANNMIIPGTVNTLHSNMGSATFITQDINALSENDSIDNLAPYFKYIKSIKS